MSPEFLFIVFAISFFVVRAFAEPAKTAGHPLEIELKPLARHLIPPSEKFQKTAVGGLSGLSWTTDSFILLSDDRGRIADPRFYEADLQWQDGKIVFKWKRVHFLRDLPGLKEHTTVVDLEGVARAADGTLVIASEADTNRKPRERNRLLQFSKDGKFLGEAKVPDDWQPEPAGQQTKGTANNSGPEGLSFSPSGHFLWVALERPLVQEKSGRKLRFDRFRRDERGDLHYEKTSAYFLEQAAEGSREVLRGVSSVLALDDNQLLVLERSAVLSSSRGLGFGGGLFHADCREEPCKKKSVLDFARDLAAFREGSEVANFEGLSWGPPLAGGGKSILLLSDNNFSRSDPSEILLLSFKEKAP